VTAAASCVTTEYDVIPTMTVATTAPVMHPGPQTMSSSGMSVAVSVLVNVGDTVGDMERDTDAVNVRDDDKDPDLVSDNVIEDVEERVDVSDTEDVSVEDDVTVADSVWESVTVTEFDSVVEKVNEELGESETDSVADRDMVSVGVRVGGTRVTVSVRENDGDGEVLPEGVAEVDMDMDIEVDIEVDMEVDALEEVDSLKVVLTDLDNECVFVFTLPCVDVTRRSAMVATVTSAESFMWIWMKKRCTRFPFFFLPFLFLFLLC
jgi:hypothetical protein